MHSRGLIRHRVDTEGGGDCDDRSEDRVVLARSEGRSQDQGRTDESSDGFAVAGQVDQRVLLEHMGPREQRGSGGYQHPWHGASQGEDDASGHSEHQREYV